MSSCFLLRLGDALRRAFRRRDGAAAPPAGAKRAAAAPPAAFRRRQYGAAAPPAAPTTGERVQASGQRDGPGPPQRPDNAGEGEAQRPGAGGRGAELRRSEPGLLGDPRAVRGQLTLKEAQATKLKATIQRRKRLQGDSGPILGHYERVLAGLEAEIAFLSGVTGPDAATGACAP